MREYKNTIVVVTGDVYAFETSTVPPSTWFDAHELTWSDVTHVQGPILDALTRTDDQVRYPDVDESTMDVLYDWIHKSKDDYGSDIMSYGVNDYQAARTVIENSGGNFNEFLSLALAEGSALVGELIGVYDSRYDAYDNYMEERYNITSSNEVFLDGLAELDMDAVEEQYDIDSGNVLLEGSDVVYEVSI